MVGHTYSKLLSIELGDYENKDMHDIHVVTLLY